MVSDQPEPEMPYFNNVEEYIAWVNENNPHFNPFVCLRHWWPIVKKFQDGEPASYSLVMTVVLTQEAFAFLPEELQDPRKATAINSWFANQTESVCCKLGDQKMAWLHLFLEEVNDGTRYCRMKPWPWREDLKGRRVCYYKIDHDGEHEWEKPPTSIFSLMDSTES